MNALPTPDSSAPMFLSIAGAVARSGLSRSTIYLALQAGDLKARKHGHRTLIDCDALRAWIEALPEWTPQHGVAE